MDINEKILYIDLGKKKSWTEPVLPELIRQYMGSRGINAYLLWKLVKPGIDPLGPDNPLIFGSGLLTGANAPMSGRTTVTCKGPATNVYLKANSGGAFGAELRYAGYLNLVVLGKAERPTYVFISDDEVEFRDASHLWGQDVRETNKLIRKELGDYELQTAAIGPAGENLVLFSSIMMSTYNAAGRGGVGAVMGSKNLKAIAVRGTGGLKFHDISGFLEAAEETRVALKEDSASGGTWLYGTSGSVLGLSEMYNLRTRNYQKAIPKDAYSVSGNYLVESGYLKRRVGCFSCIFGCHRYTELTDGEYAGTFCGGPELETIGMLGSGCDIWDLQPIIKGNELCNIYGLDTISTGALIQWAMECYERGLLTSEDVDGMDLSFGNPDAMIEMVRKIAYREGIGDLLAQGVRTAAKKVGGDSWKWATETKGLETSMVDLRRAKGYALAFAVNPRGCDHLHTEAFAEFGLTPESVEIIEKITGDAKYATPDIYDKRAEIVRWHEDTYAATDCLGFCAFSSTACFGVSPELMARLFEAATGMTMSEEDLMEAGRRIIALERCFNMREGLTRADDTIPWRFMNENTDDLGDEYGPLDAEKFEETLDEYYELHEWDVKTGIPKKETLEKLGLSYAADEMEKMGLFK